MANGFEIGVTDQEILRKTQAAVPADCRGHMVLIEFSDPIDKRKASHFYRIGLTEIHLSKGENDRGDESFFQPEIFQPQRCGPKICEGCGGLNEPRSMTVSICRNPACGFVGREIVDGPVRGVIRVDCPADYVAETIRKNPRDRFGRILADQIEIVLTRGVVLILDRRYPESVVAAVWRTAKALGEMYGWKIEG